MFFGCGNPTALAHLNQGEVVLDLGSGAGLDVLLAAKLVGPKGKVYGLDMTDEMLLVAKENQKKANIANAEFLKGHIEDIPLPDNTVDVVISNCVINLSGNKNEVIKEAFRVLKHGGRFAVSDIVLKKPLPEKIAKDILAWAGCIAGALLEEEYKNILTAAGFVEIDIEVTRELDFTKQNFKNLIDGLSLTERTELKSSIVSAFVSGIKPC